MRALHVLAPGPPKVVPRPETHLNNQIVYVAQADNIGSTHNEPKVSDVSLSRYIDQNVGGSTGVTNALGYTIGMFPWHAQRMAGVTVVPPRVSPALNTGPVGVSNWQGRLHNGVQSLFSQAPTLEQIYLSMTGE